MQLDNIHHRAAIDMLNEIHQRMGVELVYQLKLERLAVDKIAEKHIAKAFEAGMKAAPVQAQEQRKPVQQEPVASMTRCTIEGTRICKCGEGECNDLVDVFLAAGAQPTKSLKQLADESMTFGKKATAPVVKDSFTTQEPDDLTIAYMSGYYDGKKAQERKPLIGWEATRIDEYEIRVVSPEGEAWRLRSADANDIFNNFIFRWAEAMLTAKEQP